LFCEEAENCVVNQSIRHILNDNDVGRQRFSRAQRLRKLLAGYLLPPAGAIPSQWSYIN
jgi:hypothetical protein